MHLQLSHIVLQKSCLASRVMAVLCEILPFIQFFLYLKSTINSIEFSLHVYKSCDQYTNIKIILDMLQFNSTSGGEKFCNLKNPGNFIFKKNNKIHYSTRYLPRSNPSFYCTLQHKNCARYSDSKTGVFWVKIAMIYFPHFLQIFTQNTPVFKCLQRPQFLCYRVE